jgi:hypothetical protein
MFCTAFCVFLWGKVGEVAHHALLMKLEERLSKEASSTIKGAFWFHTTRYFTICYDAP